MQAGQLSNLTSPTNQSYSIVNSNVIRLEGSSCASSQPEQPSSLKGKVFMEFEQFTDTARPKKDTCLSIQIDDKFNCKFIDAPGIRNLNKKSTFEEPENTKRHHEYESNKSEQARLLVEYREKIDEMSSKILGLQQKLYFREEQNKQLKNELEEKSENCSDLQLKNEHLKQIIRKKDETLQSQKELLDGFSKKLSELEKDSAHTKFYEDKVKEKEIKLRDLTKRMQKMVSINKTLEKQLKEANQKIVQVEKQLQATACSQLQQHRHKLKQTSAMNNKENVEEGNYRKSFENAKQKKSVNVTSGTIRSYSHHTMEKKTKNIASMHRLRHV